LPSARTAERHEDPVASLTRDSFVAQDLRPAHVEEIDCRRLRADLRALLLTDGTVTRTIEALLLRRVSIEILHEAPGAVPELDRHMELGPGERTVVRRVLIGCGTPVRPVVSAESVIAPGRLPQQFGALLSGSSHGIGEALSSARLETRRELLWFGLAPVPNWVPRGRLPGPLLLRAYRVSVDRRVALVITEGFSIEHTGEMYRLRAMS
jgi:chorismate-pyruvate lyase